jgi:heme-degrading monooxygenase HmoA
MIGRIWRGTTRTEDADAYLAYVGETGLQEYRATPGNRGAMIFRRLGETTAEFLVISLWEDFEAIRRFAGPQPEKAVYYPEDDRFLLGKEPNVAHYDVTGDFDAAAATASLRREDSAG